ncbi:hypothetical protein pipiens_020235 [Culex pipiens pipiens]|uniref:Uncharacterized protein n=1 Tax=Culex pipiens pipiens TaxID=38569 RepID=A0ABD1CZ17_CULPP
MFPTDIESSTLILILGEPFALFIRVASTCGDAKQVVEVLPQPDRRISLTSDLGVLGPDDWTPNHVSSHFTLVTSKFSEERYTNRTALSFSGHVFDCSVPGANSSLSLRYRDNC